MSGANSSVRFDPALPSPYNEAWREAYRYNNDDSPRLTTYQPPNGDPVPFIMDNIRLKGGQAVDTAEYPFHGLWSNTPLNEKPHSITISGYIRGETYIKNRNAMVKALRVTTDDTDTGFIDLPLWGRFPVVVIDYEVEEKSKENGQCAVSLTFTRAGVTAEERQAFEGSGFDEHGETVSVAKELENAAIDGFENALEGNVDNSALVQGFTQLKTSLISIIGRVQGPITSLNKMTNMAMRITNLMAQGIHSPKALAEALFGTAAGIASGIMEIKNAHDASVLYFRNIGNEKRLLLQFLSSDNISIDMETVTIKQHITKDNMENLYRTMALCASAKIMVQTEMTYQEAQGFWALYEKLETAVNQNDPGVYKTIRDLRLTISRELSARKLDAELARNIFRPVPILLLAQTLGCKEETLRQLNTIADSFVVEGNIVYV